MKFPICTFDAKVGVLCPSCEARLRNGEITEADVEASFKLAKLASTIPALDKLTLRRAYKIDDDYVLVFNQGEAKQVLNNRQIMSKLNETFGKVWITEQTGDTRAQIEYLMSPVRILMVNTVYSPWGQRHIRVVIAGAMTKNFPVDLDKVKRIIRAISNDEVEFDFEKGMAIKSKAVRQPSNAP